MSALPLTRRWPLLANVLLSVASCVLFLGALEGICRLLERRAPTPPVAEYIWDWEKVWDDDFYTVGSGSTGWPPWDEFNPEGLRDRAHPLEKPPHVSRVVCLGDSVTMGDGIKAEEAYPQVLQRKLDAERRRLEVMNVALWGWSTRQERIAYGRIVRKYAPDQVLLGICLNDIPELQNNLSRPAPWLAELHRTSALVRFVVNARGREIASVEELFTHKDQARVREGFARFFAELRGLRDEVRADGGRLALLIFPFRFQVARGAPEPSVQQAILSFCAAEQLECLDLLPTLRGLGEGAFVDYDHLSPAGAAEVADAVAASKLLLPGPTLDAASAAALARLSADENVANLAAGLGDSGELVRFEAGRALAALGPRARPAVPRLFAALHDPRQSVRWQAAQALAAVGAPEASWVGPLVGALGNRDRYVRGFAEWSLGELGADAREAIPALLDALREEQAGDHGGAAAALGKLGPAAAAAVPLLVEGLKAADGPRRWIAARSLGKIGPAAKAAVPALCRALEDRNDHVRAHSARALGMIGPEARTAIPALKVATRDPEGAVRRAARGALRSLAGE